MDRTSEEWSPRDLGEPLRQGDIFVWSKPSTADVWTRLGIVVTADCDLAQNKHRDVLTYCPILELHDYLREVWIPDDLARSLAKFSKQVADRLASVRRQYRPEYDASLEPSLLLRWLSRRSVSGIADDVGLPSGKLRAEIEKQLRVLEALVDAGKTLDSAAMLTAIAKARLGEDAPTTDALRKRLEEVVAVYHDRVRTLPGDLFFLNELSADHRSGYIVGLRRLREISPNAIAVRPVEARDTPARRISRLRAPFRYRLTQKLAAMFSDIGLPREYEERCSSTVTALTAGIITTA